MILDFFKKNFLTNGFTVDCSSKCTVYHSIKEEEKNDHTKYVIDLSFSFLSNVNIHVIQCDSNHYFYTQKKCSESYSK